MKVDPSGCLQLVGVPLTYARSWPIRAIGLHTPHRPKENIFPFPTFSFGLMEPTHSVTVCIHSLFAYVFLTAVAAFEPRVLTEQTSRACTCMPSTSAQIVSQIVHQCTCYARPRTCACTPPDNDWHSVPTSAHCRPLTHSRSTSSGRQEQDHSAQLGSLTPAHLQPEHQHDSSRMIRDQHDPSRIPSHGNRIQTRPASFSLLNDPARQQRPGIKITRRR
jgi:hypothetical protein